MSQNDGVGHCCNLCIFIVMTILVINTFLEPTITNIYGPDLNYSIQVVDFIINNTWNNSEVVDEDFSTKIPYQDFKDLTINAEKNTTVS